MILKLEPRFLYIIFPAGIFLAFIAYTFRKILKKLHKKIQEKDGKVRVFLQEHIESLMIICSFATENQTEQDAVQKMEEHKKARMKKIEFQIYAISVLLVL